MSQKITDTIKSPLVQQEFFRNVLNELPGAIVVLDENCKIVWASSEWNKFGIQQDIIKSTGWLGINYFVVAQLVTLQSERELKQFKTRIKEILNGKSDNFEQDYFYNGDKEKFWFRIQANGFEFIEKQWVIINQQNITEHKKTEADVVDNYRRISEQKEMLEKTLDSLVYPLYIIDVNDYTIKYTNSAIQKLEISGPSLCHKLIHHLDAPCDSVGHNCPINEMRRTGKPVRDERIQLSINGEKQYFEVNGFPIFDADGILVQMVEYSLDITKRKLAEEKLRKSEEKFRGIFNSIPDVYSSADMDGTCVIVSPSVFEVTGYTTEEIIGRKLSEFYVNPKSHDLLYQKLQEVGYTKNFETEFIKKDGSILIASANAKIIYNDAGHPMGIDSIFRDITARKKAENAFTEAMKNLNRAQEIAQIGSWKIDIITSEIWWSDELYRIFGITIGTSITYEIFHKSIYLNDIENVIKQRLSDLKNKHYDIEHRILVDDEEKWVKIQAEVTFDKSGNAVFAFGTTQDITNQKKVEMQIKKYQKRLQALASELTIIEERQHKQIATDLHDHVGQLLTAARLQLATIKNETGKYEISKKTKTISQILLKASQSTRDAIFNLSPPQLSEIGLYGAIHDWMKDQIENKYNINTSITSDNKKYHIEENTYLLLFRSIRELIMNVLKHARARNLKINIKSNNGMLEVTVQDDGDGFDYNPDLVKFKGKGYGLFSIQERVSDLGGYIKVESKPGKGTEIKLSIPLKENVS